MTNDALRFTLPVSFHSRSVASPAGKNGMNPHRDPSGTLRSGRSVRRKRSQPLNLLGIQGDRRCRSVSCRSGARLHRELPCISSPNPPRCALQNPNLPRSKYFRQRSRTLTATRLGRLTS